METGSRKWSGSPSGYDAHDFQPVPILELAGWELRRGYGLAVMFDDDAAWGQVLVDQEALKGAGEHCFQYLPVGGNSCGFHRRVCRLFHQGGVPIFPHRIISEPTNGKSYFFGAAGVRDIELFSGFGWRFASSDGGSIHDSAVLGEV